MGSKEYYLDDLDEIAAENGGFVAHPKDVPPQTVAYDIRAIARYMKETNKTGYDMTEEELERFVVARKNSNGEWVPVKPDHE